MGTKDPSRNRVVVPAARLHKLAESIHRNRFLDSLKFIVSPGMLFCGLFIASTSKYYFGNPDGYMEWLGALYHRYSGIRVLIRT